MGLTAAASSLITGLASAAGAGASTISVARANRRGAKLARELNAQNIAYQKETNDLNYQRAMQMWNMENAYNTPKAQMQRYADAGLNPNLIYQQENTASDIGAPDAVAPQTSMDPATIVSNGGLPGLMEIGRALESAHTRYQQEKALDSRLLTDAVSREKAIWELQNQKETSEYAKRELMEKVRGLELDNSRKEYENSVEYRTMQWNIMQASFEKQRNDIEAQDFDKTRREWELNKAIEQYEYQKKQQTIALAIDYLRYRSIQLGNKKLEQEINSLSFRERLWSAADTALKNSGNYDQIETIMEKTLRYASKGLNWLIGLLD